jgi:hypothetical protein
MMKAFCWGLIVAAVASTGAAEIVAKANLKID